MTTQTKIREVLPTCGRGAWRDEAMPGLELLGNRAGATWYIRHRVGGKRLRDRVGRWPALDLQAARKAARVRVEAAAVKVAAGADVMAERREEQTAKAARRKAVTLGEALDLYRDDRLVHLRSGKHAEQVIRLVFGGLMGKALPDLARSDLTTALERKRRTAPATAETALRYAKPFFGWIGETERGENLLAGQKAKQTRKRDRTLSMRELGAVLLALDAMGDHPGALAAKALLATAGRLHEVARMEAAEVDLDAREWQLPAARNKSARVHVVPLNLEAVAAIRAALGCNTGSPFVFEGATGRTPFSGWSKLKAKVDVASGVTGWTWHDARRTFATICADRGIDAHVADRVLNHTGAGTSSTVQRIYQRSELLAARRAALDVWSVAMGEARTLASSHEVAVLKVRR